MIIIAATLSLNGLKPKKNYEELDLQRQRNSREALDDKIAEYKQKTSELNRQVTKLQQESPGDHNNNKMERMNGEVRDREKVMRGLKKTSTPILMGYQIYHNYFRPHEALRGKTPAEKCGIVIEGENKWKTVIENASKGVYP
jgi:chromosome segregation ATPase